MCEGDMWVKGLPSQCDHVVGDSDGESMQRGAMGVPPHNERTCGHVLGRPTRHLVTDGLNQPLGFQKNKTRPNEGKEASQRQRWG